MSSWETLGQLGVDVAAALAVFAFLWMVFGRRK